MDELRDDLRAGTYVLPDGERPEVAKLADFLAEHEAGQAHLVMDDHTSIELPAGLKAVLRHVAGAMQQGLGVTVVPQAPVLTTQQAADILGISRPTLIRLLDAERIPYERAGTHRRLALGDVLVYREERRSAQYRALEATAVHPDDEEDLQTTLERLRQARRAVAQRQ
jgi:excisionase family DNA binding protein